MEGGVWFFENTRKFIRGDGAAADELFFGGRVGRRGDDDDGTDFLSAGSLSFFRGERLGCTQMDLRYINLCRQSCCMDGMGLLATVLANFVGDRCSETLAIDFIFLTKISLSLSISR